MDNDNALLELLQNAPQEPTVLDKRDDFDNNEYDDFEDDNGDEEPQMISLSVRQPSFASLKGTLIPKGKDAPIDQDRWAHWSYLGCEAMSF